jgi:hypothetical protein
METLGAVGIIVGIIVGLGTIIWAVAVAVRWILAHTYIERDELARLKTIEKKYETCKSNYDSLLETCAPYLEQGRKELVSAFINKPSQTKFEIGLDRSKRLSEVLPKGEFLSDYDPFDPKRR